MQLSHEPLHIVLQKHHVPGPTSRQPSCSMSTKCPEGPSIGCRIRSFKRHTDRWDQLSDLSMAPKHHLLRPTCQQPSNTMSLNVQACDRRSANRAEKKIFRNATERGPFGRKKRFLAMQLKEGHLGEKTFLGLPGIFMPGLPAVGRLGRGCVHNSRRSCLLARTSGAMDATP